MKADTQGKRARAASAAKPARTPAVTDARKEAEMLRKVDALLAEIDEMGASLDKRLDAILQAQRAA